ncbi:hypothetical protein IPA_07830 [Ignicoccus pacificus DSM 13166]|uniref:Uncharacterized protein n=1 Tax=Ignicoccus pacificus DSM 13166 TaxID=940294 RepID=A0A977PKD1_9CREN|nr:hypothetical protein IPA_07830 [Ignicoccus pacificus DSM 13166]
MRALLPFLLLTLAVFALNLKPTADCLTVAKVHPEAVLLYQALSGSQPNTALLAILDSAPDKLIATLSLKLLGYKVNPNMLDVVTFNPCGKAEKAFVYFALGLPGWKELAKEVSSLSVFRIENYGLACACKAAFFLKLIGYKPSWVGLLLNLKPSDVTTVEGLIWCSALQKEYGIDTLYETLLKYLSPDGCIKNEIGLKDYDLTAQFLIAYSLLQYWNAPKITATPTTAQGVTLKTITITATTLKTLTKTVYETIKKTVVVTVSGCIPLSLAETRVLWESTETVRTVDLRNVPYAVYQIDASKGDRIVVDCNGGCGSVIVGENVTLYPQVVGGSTTYAPQGGSWNSAPCGSQLVWNAKGPVTVYALGNCPITLTIVHSVPEVYVCK